MRNIILLQCVTRAFTQPRRCRNTVVQGLIMCDGVDSNMRRYFGLLYGHMGRCEDVTGHVAERVGERKDCSTSNQSIRGSVLWLGAIETCVPRKFALRKLQCVGHV